MPNHPKIILLGTGAVGSLYVGKLAQAGASVSAVCRSDYQTVKADGIRINSGWGDFHFRPDEVLKDIAEYSSIPDYIVVATKVLPRIDVAKLIQSKVSPQTSIVLLQNGIDIEEPIARAFPDNEIISALAFVCVSRIALGHVDHLDYGRLIIGTYPSGRSEKVELLAKLFIDAGVECVIADTIVTARWIKLVWNAPFNPMSVLGGGVDTMAMTGTEPSLILARKVMEEVRLLAEATGHPFPEVVILKNIDDTMVMKPYKTSMLLDYENGREMEVEAILGNAVRIAHKHAINVPHIESLYGLLTLLNNKQRAKA
jgi:2-dehydropantoate 2-reductase